jgi:hypothetical protein
MTPGRMPSMRPSALAINRQGRLLAARRFQVQHDRALAAVKDRRRADFGHATRIRPVDENHVRAEIREQHAAERPRPEAATSTILTPDNTPIESLSRAILRRAGPAQKTSTVDGVG